MAPIVDAVLSVVVYCLSIRLARFDGRNWGHGAHGYDSAKSQSHGYTLIELVTITAIIGALSSLAIPTYSYYIEKTKTTVAIAELRMVERDIIVFFNNNSRYPTNLAETGQGGLSDPWGNPYQYLDVTTAAGLGQCRSNKFNNPINSDFDLFSMGPDGAFVRAVTAAASRDDILRADNGRFLGPATDL